MELGDSDNSETISWALPGCNTFSLAASLAVASIGTGRGRLHHLRIVSKRSCDATGSAELPTVVAIVQDVLTFLIGPIAVISAAIPITPALGSSLLTSTPMASKSIR